MFPAFSESVSNMTAFISRVDALSTLVYVHAQSCYTYYNFTRQQAEAKLKHLTSHHETTETVSQQEVTEWKEKYEQSKEKAKEYSELVRIH